MLKNEQDDVTSETIVQSGHIVVAVSRAAVGGLLKSI